MYDISKYGFVEDAIGPHFFKNTAENLLKFRWILGWKLELMTGNFKKLDELGS